MDSPTIDPTIIVAIIGIISTIAAGIIGRQLKHAQAEEIRSTAAERLGAGYERLVDSWEQRLADVKKDVLLLRQENIDLRVKVERLALAEAEIETLKTRITILEREYEETVAERDSLRQERDALWKRVYELERVLSKLGHEFEDDGALDV